MKIIALLPFKNEAHMLPSYLSSVRSIADEVIALDDNSMDDGPRILQDAGAVVLKSSFPASSQINMSKRRSLLLEEGRKRGGTHFIWLDADETFSADFIPQARAHIEKLSPGQTLTMRWVHIWGDTNHYLNDSRSPFGYLWKDFVSCDNGKDNFEDQFLSEGRTPGAHDQLVRLEEKDGVVLHFQFLDHHRVQMKQSWYRCVELIEGTRGARRINHTYRHSLPDNTLTTSRTLRQWIKGLILPSLQGTSSNWHLADILKMFEKYGVRFFEPLEIWHVPELRKYFIQVENREPRSHTYPSWLIALRVFTRKFL